MPVSRNAHHTQFSATPCSRIRFVTRLGVSVLKVVATIEIPMSHHGAARPDVKNSAVLDPARRQKNRAGRNEMMMEAAMTARSSGARCIGALISTRSHEAQDLAIDALASGRRPACGPDP